MPVSDRWHGRARPDVPGCTEHRVTGPPTREHGRGRRWIARWRDPDGKQHSASFDKKSDAERHGLTVAADMMRGVYLDPAAGKETVKAYAARWLTAQTFDPATREAVALRLRLHVYPVLGPLQLRQVRPSTVQSWLRGLDRLAPSYRRVVFANVSGIFAAAVADEVLARNPCQSPAVQKPRVDSRKIVPWPTARVHAVHAALPERARPVVTIGAGLGLRQGEIFALSPDDVDWLRGKVEIRRQVKVFPNNQLVLALPKGRKTRTVPLPEIVRADLAAYAARHPARAVTLPWESPGGEPVTVKLILTTRESKAVNRNYFNGAIWKRALVAGGIEPTRENGCHALRHYYASTLLDAGESIRAVSEYLGHSDPGFTLRTYTHLLPSSEERTRRAMDEALGARAPVVHRASE